MNFTFFSPVKIFFGPETARTLTDVIRSLTDVKRSRAAISNISPPPSSVQPATTGKGIAPAPSKVLVVTGGTIHRADNIFQSLDRCGLPYDIMSQTGEPTIEGIIPEVEKARNANVDLVIAQGGGSVIDAGKALAALVPNKEDVMHYLEVIGNGSPLTHQSLPMIAIPTTAGTGSEITSNAVLASLEHQVKVSLRSNAMYPDVAIVDPALTLSVPQKVTASTGMDALTQLIESFTSKFAGPFTDALCRDGIMRVVRSLKTAWKEPDNISARSDMCLAALYSGVTLANAKLGAVHGIAGPMGGMIHAPHGMICARLLGPVMRENYRLLNNKRIREKYLEVSRMLTAAPLTKWEEGVDRIDDLVNQMQLPSLSQLGLTPMHIPPLAKKAQKASSMKGNPVSLTVDQIKALLFDNL